MPHFITEESTKHPIPSTSAASAPPRPAPRRPSRWPTRTGPPGGGWPAKPLKKNREIDKSWLVVSTNPAEKYEFVSWDDDIPILKILKMFETTNQNDRDVENQTWKNVEKNVSQLISKCENQNELKPTNGYIPTIEKSISGKLPRVASSWNFMDRDQPTVQTCPVYSASEAWVTLASPDMWRGHGWFKKANEFHNFKRTIDKTKQKTCHLKCLQNQTMDKYNIMEYVIYIMELHSLSCFDP